MTVLCGLMRTSKCKCKNNSNSEAKRDEPSAEWMRLSARLIYGTPEGVPLSKTRFFGIL